MEILKEIRARTSVHGFLKKEIEREKIMQYFRIRTSFSFSKKQTELEIYNNYKTTHKRKVERTLF